MRFPRDRPLATLALLKGSNKTTRLQQTVMRAGIEPCETAAHQLNVELAFIQVVLINVSYL